MTDSAGLRLVAVNSDIGRGHPSYLDSVLLSLSRQPGFKPDMLSLVTLDRICSGTSKHAWKLARSLYYVGAHGGILTSIYNRLRKGGKPSPLQLAILGSSLRKRLTGFPGICLVEHPLVAHILAPVCKTAYLHGEITAPPVAAVPEAWRTFVPLESTADALVALGVKRSALTVTGLVIEPKLITQAEHAFMNRLDHYRSAQPLTIGFFTSGAYPNPHVDRIIAGAKSCWETGYRPIIFAGWDLKRAKYLARKLQDAGVPVINIKYLFSGQPIFITAPDRRKETALLAKVFSQLDIMVAACHERTNWAIGLGLPMFALLPNIGPFAPLNYWFATKQGVCRPIRTILDAEQLGLTVSELRRAGQLRQIAETGLGKHATSGAESIARTLLAEAI